MRIIPCLQDRARSHRHFRYVIGAKEFIYAHLQEPILQSEIDAHLGITAEYLCSVFKKRILLRGDVTVTAESAKALAAAGVFLIGVESQSVGEIEHPMEVHKLLLSQKIVLLEGLRLDKISDGSYFLCAAPLSLAGLDGAPCRAVLIETDSFQ